jgi:Kef-type K+ transport system membrane component KefB
MPLIPASAPWPAGIVPDASWWSWPSLREADPVIALAAVMLLALVLADLAYRLLRLPRLLSYMLVGALASPLGLGLLQRGDLVDWKPLLDLAIAVLVFELGSRLRPRWLLDNPWLALSCVLEGLLATLAVGYLLAWLGAPVLSAMAAGVVAGATSPVIAMASVHELRPRGQVSERLLLMCALNSVLAMLALKLWPVLAAAGQSNWATDALGWGASALFVASGSFLLGLACGWLVDRTGRPGGHRATMPVLQIALVMLASTLASIWGLSPLLTMLIAGIAARKLMGHRLTVEPSLGSAGAALTVLLFLSTGLLFTLDGLVQLWPWVLAIVVARLLGKSLAVLLLARPSGLGWRQAAALTLALQPMGGLAVLLVMRDFAWQSQLPGIDIAVLQALLVATTLMQLSGPLWVQLGLRRVADECPPEPRHGA